MWGPGADKGWPYHLQRVDVELQACLGVCDGPIPGGVGVRVHNAVCVHEDIIVGALDVLHPCVGPRGVCLVEQVASSDRSQLHRTVVEFGVHHSAGEAEGAIGVDPGMGGE